MKAIVSVFCSLLAFAETFAGVGPGGRFGNLDQMVEQINLAPYFRAHVSTQRKLKVAVFDNGFRFAQEQVGKSLPAFTKIHHGPVPLKGEEETHGFYMARIVWSLVTLDGSNKRFEPEEFHLYYTFGYSNFAFAIQDVIDRKIDVVLYSQTWEYGGNFNGGGFVNALVSKASQAGILWINNAGNFGRNTYNSMVSSSHDDWAKLPNANESLEIRCEENPSGKCHLRAVLSWNDFSDDVNTGTDKDLDFVLSDDMLNIIQKSELIQKKEVDPGEFRFSKYPREIITAELTPGKYFLRVKIRSKNFTSSDYLRITTSGDFITMRSFDSSESLLPPADNPQVISVGAIDSDRSGFSKRLNKPELWTTSLVSLSQEENFKGSSNSAAMVAAAAVVLKSLNRDMNRQDFLRWTMWNPKSALEGLEGRGLPLQMLGFGPTDPRGCFRIVDLSVFQVPNYLRYPISRGGVLVETTAGLKVFFEMDPISITPYRFRNVPNDMIGYGLQGIGIFPRMAQASLPTDFFEVLQVPAFQKICGIYLDRKVETGKLFRLPDPM